LHSRVSAADLSKEGLGATGKYCYVKTSTFVSKAA
jgi:hypothetical protein